VVRDPIARIIVIGSLSCGALMGGPAWYLAIIVAAYAAWTRLARIPLGALVSRAGAAFLFLGLIVLVNAATTSGTVAFEIGGLYVTREGLARGGMQAARLSLVIWGAMIAVSTGNIEDLQDALERWTARRGRPLVAAGGIAVSHLPSLVESARRVMLARRARGEKDRPGILRAVGQVSAAALPLLACALRDADALAEAMESRCYDPLAPRTPFRTNPVSPKDIGAAVAATALTITALLT